MTTATFTRTAAPVVTAKKTIRELHDQQHGQPTPAHSTRSYQPNATRTDTPVKVNAQARPLSAHMPQAMRERAQWAVGRYGKPRANGKRAKVPYDAKTGQPASTTNPDTWSTYDQAMHAYQGGGYDFFGFILSELDPFTFIDLDDCIRNGEMAPTAYATIQRFASYTETSISGTGVHIIALGKAPAGRKHGNVEVYSDRRFVVMTGDIVAGFTTIGERQVTLDQFYTENFPAVELAPTPSPATPNTELPASDHDLIKIIRASKQGSKFDVLWDGTTTGYSSASEADIALCAILAFWTGGDPERIDRMFRQSGLYRADKWNRAARASETYGQGTVSRAIGQVSARYQQPQAMTEVERLIHANRGFIAGQAIRSATQRVLLALLTHFERVDTLTAPVSSRHISDLTGLSHRSVQMELRLLCPQTRSARIERLSKEKDRVQAQFTIALNATTPQEALRVLRPREQDAVIAKRGHQGDEAVIAGACIYLQHKIERCEKELRFYDKNEARGNTFNLLRCNSKCDGTAFANIYTLQGLQNDVGLTLQKVSTEGLDTVLCDGGPPPHRV